MLSMPTSLSAWLIPLFALALGAAFGALLVAWRARKQSEALHIELAVLKSQVGQDLPGEYEPEMVERYPDLDGLVTVRPSARRLI